jgi:hypothetical protein
MLSASIKKNLAERSSQVKIMGRIYEQATKVLCWLGAAKDGYGFALASLDTSRLELCLSLTIEDSREIVEDFISQALNEQTCAALEHLASSPYWPRTWIRQEIAMAREIVLLYGSTALQWPMLRTLNVISPATSTMGPSVFVSSLRQRKDNA